MVYFLKEEREGGLIKIGYVKSEPHRRIRMMQTGNPALLRLLSVIPSATRRDETKLHRRFRDARVYIRGGGRHRTRFRGEWFKPTEELLKFIESLPPWPLPFVPKPAEPVWFGPSNDG